MSDSSSADSSGVLPAASTLSINGHHKSQFTDDETEVDRG